MAAGAVLPGKRIYGLLVLDRVRRKIQALSHRLDGRRRQLHLGGGRRARGARPVADPCGQNLTAGIAVRQPAIVTAAHLGDDERLGGLRQIDHGVGLHVGKIHIVAAGKVGHLRRTGRVVALAAAVLGAHVAPETDLESLDVGRYRRGSRISVGRTARHPGTGRGRRRRAGAAAGTQGKGRREGEQAGHACRVHAQFPMQ